MVLILLIILYQNQSWRFLEVSENLSVMFDLG